MNKADFLKRCETIYDLGLLDNNTHLMYKWLDAIMRYEGNQKDIFEDFIEHEKIRTDNFSKVLVRDVDGYKLIQLSAILDHHCQICAEDTEAWHTRGGFCKHTQEEKQSRSNSNERLYKINNIFNKD